MKSLSTLSTWLSRVGVLFIAVTVFTALMVVAVIGFSACSSDEEPTAEPFQTRTPTPVPPTKVPTATPAPRVKAATRTPVPPTPTKTAIPVPPTATSAPETTNTATPVPSTPTATPVPPTAVPTATPIPPTAIPTATPVPPTATLEPTATATPIPASYTIDSLDWDIRGAEGDKIAVRFTLKVTNEGEAQREGDTSVNAMINGGERTEIAIAPPLGGGESTTLLFDVRLDPGQQQLRLELDDSVSHVALDLLASDIVISPVHYQVIADGKVSVRVKLANVGSLPTRPIQLIALNNVVATVQPIEAGESDELSFTLDLEVGTHVIEVTAAADEREAKLSNNTATFEVEVDYVALELSAGSARALGFIRGGTANVGIDFSVKNVGVAPSNEFVVAVACPDASEGTCVGEVNVESLAPGGSYSGTIDAVVPQGTSGIVLFAGELEYGYRWGDANTIPITIDVPLQPDIDPVFEVEAELAGYYSNGDAAITISATLRNDGAEPIPGDYPVAISCSKDDEIVASCGDIIDLELTDGFGPATGTAVVRAVAGEIDVQLEGGEIVGIGEGLSSSVRVSIPERIVGVDRGLWRCFTEIRISEEFPSGNCSGRSGDVVSKWPQDEPVTIWINGLSTYEEQLQDTLQTLAPQLNVTYQLVPDERRAAIAAYVGITEDDARSLGFIRCDGFWGCTNYETDENGEIISAEIVIFQIDGTSLRQLRLIDESIRYAMVQSLLAVLVPLEYRDVPDSIMSIDRGLRFAVMSESDREIVWILTSPLVKTGDTTADIEGLIVFSDETLDVVEPEPLTNLEIVEKARLKLYESGSALFNMSGGWSGGTCIDRFGPSQVTVAEFAAHRGLHYRLTDASERFYVFLRSEEGRAEYWDGGSRAWRRFSAIDEQALIDETAWNPQYSDPMVLLASALWFGGALLTEIDRNEEEIEFRIERFRAYAAPSWTDEAVLAASFTINLSNFEIETFTMEWAFDVRGLVCDEYSVEANLIEYGASLSIPSDIRDRSRVVE